MPKTIQIRNISDEVYEALARRAGKWGISVPALLKREATRLAFEAGEATPLTMKEWLERMGQRPVNLNVTPDHVLEVLDEIRGPWPEPNAD